ncbi:hypothetical protein [Mesorhizobium sp. M1393]
MFTIFFGLELIFIRILAIAGGWACVLGRCAGVALGETLTFCAVRNI